jgi:hypothetical protein
MSKPLLVLTTHSGLGVSFLVLHGHFQRDMSRKFLGQFCPELVHLPHKLVGGIVAGALERESVEAGHLGLHTGSDRHAYVPGAALGLPAGCFS